MLTRTRDEGGRRANLLSTSTCTRRRRDNTLITTPHLFWRRRRNLEEGIGQAIADQDDVLAAYEQFVKWLGQHERDTRLVHDYEILEVLEEAVRTLKDDQHYKKDLRYVKLWTMYAKRVRKPDAVYAFLFKNAIGDVPFPVIRGVRLGS